MQTAESRFYRKRRQKPHARAGLLQERMVCGFVPHPRTDGAQFAVTLVRPAARDCMGGTCIGGAGSGRVDDTRWAGTAFSVLALCGTARDVRGTVRVISA